MRQMKDSGIAWVGEIPQEWQSVRSKFIIQSNDGGVWGGEPTDTDLDKIVLRSTEQTIEGKWKITSPAYRNLSTVSYKNCLIRPNDLLITKSSGSALHIGKTSLAGLEFANYEYYYSNFLQRIRVNKKYAPKTIHKGDYCISLRSFQGGFEYSEYEGVVSPAYQVFYPIVNVDRGYYKYLFKEKGFIEVMNSYTMSLRDGKNIAFDDFGNTFIPVPPVEEQKIIAEYLNKKCAEIEQTITDKKAQLDTLDEYKKSLIYEYVTGKKEVV